MLKTGLVFGDNMVIQTAKPFVIWGTCSHNLHTDLRNIPPDNQKNEYPDFQLFSVLLHNFLRSAYRIPYSTGLQLAILPPCAWMSEKSVKTAGFEWWSSYEQQLNNLDIDQYKAAYKHNIVNDRTNPFEGCSQ